MTVKQLRAFLAVARTLSFAQAGELVHLSQPALSLAIKKLEESLGGPLLIRSTRAVSLTPEGRALYARGQRLLAEWDNTEEELQQRFSLQRGKVALAAMPSFAGILLPEKLLAYRRRFPNIRVEVHDVIAERVVEMVLEGRIELGITFDPGPSDELTFEPLFDDELIAALPPDHADSDRRVISWARLLQDDFITLQRPSSVRLWMESQLAQHGLVPRVILDTHQLVTVGRMVAAGLGVAAVPALCRQQVEEVGGRCVRLEAPVISRPVGILRRRRHGLSMAADEMLRVLREGFRR